LISGRWIFLESYSGNDQANNGGCQFVIIGR